MDIEKLKEQLQNRINHKRSDANGYFRDAQKLEQQAREALAEATGLEYALDNLKAP